MLESKKYLLLGLGKVTKSLAGHLRGEVFGFEEKDSQLSIQKYDSSSNSFSEIENIPGTFDTLDWKKFLPAKVFLSPGIDPRRKFFQFLQSFEIRELDYFCEKFKGKIFAVTGTDGKSTFTTQFGEVLRRAWTDKKIFVGGNLGNAMSEGLLQPYDIAVLEISSFQAERLKSARVDYGILLNLAVDHLDRYDELEEYYAMKWNLLRHAKACVFPTDVEVPKDVLPKKLNAVSYKNSSSLQEILKKFTAQIIPNLKPEWLENLPTLPHRLDVYEDSTGCIFVDDSKATTVHAAVYGLNQMQKAFTKVIQIVGGRHKGDDFGEIASTLRPADQLLICGEAASIIEEHIVDHKIQKKTYRTLKELLSKEISVIRPGECLLLSPACSSYDEFENFEERGNFFISEVQSKRGSLKIKKWAGEKALPGKK